MSFTYTLDIPNPPNDPSVDAPLMKTNTNSINSLIAVDHNTFDQANAGTHKYCHLMNVTGSSPPAGITGYGTVYSQVKAGATELFFERETSGVAIQLTGPGTTIPSAVIFPTQLGGSTFLPGGLVMKYGFVNIGGVTGDYVISFTTLGIQPFPNNYFSSVGSVHSSAPNPAGQCYIVQGTESTDGFTVHNISSGVASFNWIAIGN